MAPKESWSDRSADGRRRTLFGYAGLYGVIAVIAILFAWIVIAAICGFIAAGLVIGATMQESDPPPRPRPDWMQAIDDPDVEVVDRSLTGEALWAKTADDADPTPVTPDEAQPPPSGAPPSPAG